MFHVLTLIAFLIAGIHDAADDQALSVLLTRLDFRSFLERLRLPSVFTKPDEEHLSITAAFDALESCDSTNAFFDQMEEGAQVAFFLPKGHARGSGISESYCTTNDANILIARIFSGK